MSNKCSIDFLSIFVYIFCDFYISYKTLRASILTHLLRVILKNMSILNYFEQNEFFSTRHIDASLLNETKIKCLKFILRFVICFKSCNCENLLICKIFDNENENIFVIAFFDSSFVIQLFSFIFVTIFFFTFDWRFRFTSNWNITFVKSKHHVVYSSINFFSFKRVRSFFTSMFSSFFFEIIEYFSEIEKNIIETNKLRLQIKQLKKTMTTFLNVIIEIIENRNVVDNEIYWILKNENFDELKLSFFKRRTKIRMRNKQKRKMRRNYKITKIEKKSW